MKTQVSYLSEIINAITYYNGVATLKEINEYILNRNILPAIKMKTNKKWEHNVSKTIQIHSSDSNTYRGAEDIFYSVYGIRGGVWGLRNFREKISFLQNPLEIRAEDKIKTDNNLDKTEKEMLIKARIGQGLFREKLITKYGKCIVTGIENKSLLIASHIKPWCLSNNYERLSPENGLLLSPLYDKLFDIGFITFTSNGYMIISEELKKDKNKIIFDKDYKYIKDISDELKNNLKYHNDVKFKG